MAADKKIQTLVDSFVSELSALVHEAALEQVQDALRGAAPRRGPGRPRGAGRKAAPAAPKRAGKRIRRSTEDVDSTAAKILAYVKSNDGASITEIASSLGATSKDLRLPVQKLLAEKAMSTTGQRRGTRYHAGGRKSAPRKKAKKKVTKRKKAGRR